MPPPGHNEADTRAKLINPALRAARWVERVAEAERSSHGDIKREQSAVRVEIVDGKPIDFPAQGAGYSTLRITAP